MSAVVTDTHALLWYLSDSAKLSTKAAAVFDEAERDGQPIYVPAIILIELRYLVERGRDITEADFGTVIAKLNDPTSALTFVPLDQQISEDLEHIARSIVPDMPDRLIAATAYSLNVPLVTRDSKIRDLTNVDAIW
jgi:PIN domain nuclease of toxin-antitoxin system